MSIANTNDRYGTLSKTFHWLTVLLIFTVIPLGIIAHDANFATDAELARKALLFSLHKTVGITLFAVALARIIWTLTQQKPGSLNPDRKAEHFAAELVHWLLYGSLVLVPLSGWITHAATEGFAPIWWPFGQSLPFVPKSVALSETFSTVHMLLERVMLFSLIAHIAGALKHHVIDRDATLRRMWFGRVELPQIRPHHGTALPIIGALVIWAGVLGTGAALGAFAPHEHEHGADAVVLDQVASDWQVIDGSVAIEVLQFGSVVQGNFANWTASITFDPEASGVMGHVVTEIAIGSLTLGSVTDQAMGADYFDAATFPTATFEADITRDGDSYVAAGTLTLKGTTMPLTLPFDLVIEANTATMQGRFQLNRMDYGIGLNQNSESNLGFGVDVQVNLTAAQS